MSIVSIATVAPPQTNGNRPHPSRRKHGGPGESDTKAVNRLSTMVAVVGGAALIWLTIHGLDLPSIRFDTIDLDQIAFDLAAYLR